MWITDAWQCRLLPALMDHDRGSNVCLEEAAPPMQCCGTIAATPAGAATWVGGHMRNTRQYKLYKQARRGEALLQLLAMHTSVTV